MKAGERGAGGPEAGPYLGFMALYSVSLVGFLAWVRRSGRSLPGPSVADIVLVAMATHKGSRLLTKERVTAPLRQPFADVEGEGELPRELDQEPRGTGWRRALGELLICPYCLAQWLATTLFAGLVVAPHVTRFVAALLSAVGLADFLQAGYRAAQRRA